jgi:hypothetical protein
MGCFNFNCIRCGEGTNGDYDGRDYFDKPVHISVPTKDGRNVILEGRYTGYGEVEVVFGDKTETFYPKQFKEFWDCWGPVDQFVAGAMYCEDCMWNVDTTSRATFDLNDFERVVDYMARHEKPAKYQGLFGRGASSWGTSLAAAGGGTAAPAVAAGGGAAAPAAAPVLPAVKLKVVKPKPLKKDDLLKQNAELQKQNAELAAQIERMRLMEQRFKTLEEENKRLRESVQSAKKREDKIRQALDDW